MGAYLLRRLLLVIPTLLGIMIINFTLTQFVPGGPVEQVIASMEGRGNVLQGITGGTSGAGADDQFAHQGAPVSGLTGTKYVGARGLPPEFIEQLEREFGFDKPPLERFVTMIWNYLRLDFGTSYFRSISVVDLVLEKMPVSITLGLWTTLIAYGISIPLGIPGFLFAIVLLVLFAGGSYWKFFPLRGLVSDGWEQMSLWAKAIDYLWHITLPVIASTIASFATLTLLTKNSFLDEIKKHYVMTARAKGLSEARVLYGHVFRNAMLIVIASFPAVFVGVFFGGSVIIETIFSLDGLGRLGLEAALQRDYPVIFGTLFVFGLIGLVVGILSDLMYVWIDPRIDFGSRG
jgi:microcin C transport system permease protein